MEFTTGVRLEIRIDPSDVGKRVSVRSHTGSGEKSAKFTDTVGVLTSWTADVLSITRRDGVIVRLAADALVAGKVVPAAPARRPGLPATSVRELTEVAARGWPAPERQTVDGWRCRAAGGWTHRANSALPPPGPDPAMLTDETADRIAEWYAARELPALVHVVTGAAGGQEILAAELDRRGWRTVRPAVVRVAGLAPIADREPHSGVRLHRELTEEWLRGCPGAPRNPDMARRVLTAGPSVWFATISGADAGEEPAAVARCVVDGRWAGFAALEVAAGYRGRGLATALMAELARVALNEGASAAYLQVEVGNEAARGLYDRLGFADHHHYHYRLRDLG